MQLSRKKRRWISVGVGLVGLITIVGLSDIIFLIPRENMRSIPQTEITQNNTSTQSEGTSTSSANQDGATQKASDTLEFSL